MRSVIGWSLALALAPLTCVAVRTVASSSGSSAPVSAVPTGMPVFGLKIAGGKLVSTLNGASVQLRGANVSSLEGSFTSATPDYFAGAHLGTYPWWRNLTLWKLNAVRIPLNEAAWLRYPCTHRGGNIVQPDFSGNYQTTVKRLVKDAVAAGLYVILDLHWSAPGTYLPQNQDQLPDMDHSVAFWTSVANMFKDNPAVVFDLFNEPYADSYQGIPSGANSWQVLRDGATLTYYNSDSGHYHVPYKWQSAGMQTLVNTVRATGATNIVMVGGLSGANDLSSWLAYKPSDPINQLAASWHAYDGVESQDANALSILNAGVPVIIGETGDKSANGTTNAPVITAVTAWADQHGSSVLAWTWDVWNDSSGNPGKEDLLIKDASGTPTDGEGVVFKNWVVRHN